MAGHSWLTKAVGKVNFIVNFFMDPCDAPASVYLETMFPALMDMLVDLYAFDVSEYSQQKGIMIRTPKDKKGKSKTRRGRKGGGRKRWWHIFQTLSEDPGEILGKKHARDFGGSQRLLTGARAHFWIIGGIAQRFAFWLWFISRLSQFITDWWTGLVAAGYCTERGSPVLLAYEYQDGSIPLVGWAPVNLWTILKQRGDIIWNVGVGRSMEYDLTVVFRCVVSVADPLNTSEVFLRLITDPGSGPGKIVDEQQLTVTGTAQKIVGLNGKIPKGAFFAVEVSNTSGTVRLNDCYLHAFSQQSGPFDGLLHIARDERGERE